MRYAKSIPSTDTALSDTLKKEGWIKLKEPTKPMSALIFSLPFMLINSVMVLILIYLLNPTIFEIFQGSSDFSVSITLNVSSLIYVVGVVVFFMLHEIIHVALIPNFFRSNKTFWGINGIGLFIYTSEKISKRRFIAISIMPFLALSTFFPIILSAVGCLNGYTIFLCLLNGMGSSIDFLNIFLIMRQVPQGSLIITNGNMTYYSSTE